MKRYNLYKVHFVDAPSVGDVETVGVLNEHGSKDIKADLDKINDACGNFRLISTGWENARENEATSICDKLIG